MLIDVGIDGLVLFQTDRVTVTWFIGNASGWDRVKRVGAVCVPSFAGVISL